MGRWVDPDWYRYLWYRLGRDGRLGLGVLAAAAAAFAGFFAVQALGSDTDTSPSAYVVGRTITKVERMTANGRTVVKRVPVLQQRVATVVRTATLPGHAATVAGAPRVVVRYRRVLGRHVGTTPGRVETVSRVVTEVRTATVVQPQTTTVVQTAPSETVLVREAPPTVTVAVTVTTTVPMVTITVPTYTVTVSLP